MNDRSLLEAFGASVASFLLERAAEDPRAAELVGTFRSPLDDDGLERVPLRIGGDRGPVPVRWTGPGDVLLHAVGGELGAGFLRGVELEVRTSAPPFELSVLLCGLRRRCAGDVRELVLPETFPPSGPTPVSYRVRFLLRPPGVALLDREEEEVALEARVVSRAPSVDGVISVCALVDRDEAPSSVSVDADGRTARAPRSEP